PAGTAPRPPARRASAARGQQAALQRVGDRPVAHERQRVDDRRSSVGPSGSAKVTGPPVSMQRAYGELGANAMTWPGGKASRETRWPARAKVVPSLRVTTSPPVDWPTGSPPLSRCSSTNTPALSAKAGTMAASVSPVISVRSRRAFLGRAVRYLAREAGIRQFIDIGSGIPTEQNVHEVAQAA